MNDFTKEELLILNLELETRIANAKILKVPDHVVKLKDKIQSMIDSYCEHVFLTHPVKGFPMEREVKCNKCGKIK